MVEKKKGFKIHGKVIEKESKQGIPDLTVKAIDKDLFFDDLLGTTTTDEKGNFEIKYDKEDFQELFFDKKPDLYLKIKNQHGEVIHTTEDKVRYGAGETEEFIVKIPKDLLQKEEKMKWDIKKSDELKVRIAEDVQLMKELSNSVDNVLKEHKIDLKGMSYVFEPRVFSMDPDEAPEVMMKSRAAMLSSIMQDLIKKGLGTESYNAVEAIMVTECLPKCGPMDPATLKVLERIRITDKYQLSDSNQLPASEALIMQIVGNKKLLEKLSTAIFNVIEKNGITFKENEGCVFTPCVFERPIFAQKVATSESPNEIRGFGPQIYAGPNPDPWTNLKVKPFPGIIDTKWGPTPGVIVDRWWWIGIPAPEMLNALDIMREIGNR